MYSSQQTLKYPGQVGRGEGWGRQCCDGGGASGEASQVKGRNRPRTSPEVLSPSSWGLRGEGQSEAECSGRAGPWAKQKQTQASWCRPEAVLPITCLLGLQKKTCRKEGFGEKGEKKRKISAQIREILHPSLQMLMEC